MVLPWRTVPYGGTPYDFFLDSRVVVAPQPVVGGSMKALENARRIGWADFGYTALGPSAHP